MKILELLVSEERWDAFQREYGPYIVSSAHKEGQPVDVHLRWPSDAERAVTSLVEEYAAPMGLQFRVFSDTSALAGFLGEQRKAVSPSSYWYLQSQLRPLRKGDVPNSLREMVESDD